jgi:hypothetical protein
VGDVFEVMAQVDHHLTKVNSFDRIIMVNNPAENLGRHICGCPRRFVSDKVAITSQDRLQPMDK